MRLRVAFVALIGAACSGAHGTTTAPESGSFRVAGVGSHVDPTVRPARLLPESVDETQSYGTEPGGGLRTIAAGLRIVTSSQGAIVAAPDRLPQPPHLVTQVPERLGGGFLYVLGTTIWRSDRWLDPAAPIFTSPQSIQSIVPGLDRVYLRTNGTYLAIDARNGRAVDLGPWPASPHVTTYAAADGWRAAAVTDLRGVVATYDAGATWRPLDLPIEPRVVLVSGDSLAIGGVEGGRTDAWFEARGDGSLARLAGAPREARGKTMAPSSPRPIASAWPSVHPGALTIPSPFPTLAPAASSPPTTSDPPARDAGDSDAATRLFGKRPLAAAIEDGWPLTDGTAVVARDGALGRVRLADGTLLEIVQGAFALKPSRCHPLSLTRKDAPGAFGFVCGEPKGATVVYAYDPLRGRLSTLRRFERPRSVISSGNGALAVRGHCSDEVPKLDAATHPYCVLGHDNAWREVHVRGDVSNEHVVVLEDGRIVVISPPSPGGGGAARLTILDHDKATTVPITFPKAQADVARVLRLGVWLDGFEERRKGVVGGWLEAGGVMLGVEIRTEGTATVGEYVRDAGMPFVAGRYGFGWTASKRGYETVDGGMTWTPLELPELLVPLTKVERRAVGPIGAIAGGWLRVGWGEAKQAHVPAAPPVYRPSLSVTIPHPLLVCEPLAPAPPPVRHVEAHAPPAPTRRPAFGTPPVLGPAGGVAGATELLPFSGHPAPALREADRGVSFDAQDLAAMTAYTRGAPLAKVYVWGPRTGEWDTLGRWQVRWLNPFAGWPEARASVPVLPPQEIVELAKIGAPFGYGGGYSAYGTSGWHVATGDDPSHALLVVRRWGRTDASLYELEADRTPVEVRRADGEPFVELDGVVRSAGRWFVAIPAAAGVSPPVTTVFQIDGAVARELVRVPRAGVEVGRATGAKLARRERGRGVGLVVDGPPTPERNVSMRWVLPIDLDSAQTGEPEPVGYVDLGGTVLEACTDDAAGWVVDTALAGMTARLRLPQGTGSLHSLFGRVRLTTGKACLERVTGVFGGTGPAPEALVRRGPAQGAGKPGGLRPGEIVATALSGQVRHPLRCAVSR